MREKMPWWDRLNKTLMPYIGPPALGPYNQAPLPPTGPKPCPLCGAPMDEHEIERAAHPIPTRIICPSARDSSTTAA